jgi:hypothetical protein
LVNTPAPTLSKRLRLTVNPFDPAMNCVPARMPISALRKVIPSKYVWSAARTSKSAKLPLPSKTTSPSPAATIAMGMSAVPSAVK